MKAVVPAAGEGTRLRSLTVDTPKALVDVAGTPLLGHVFETLSGVDPDEIVVVVGYEGDQIVEEFGKSYRGIPLRYVEQNDRLGLAHAIARARRYVEDPFLVLNGDNVFIDGIAHVNRRFEGSPADGVLVVEEASRERARDGGVVETEGDTVTRVLEKPVDPPSRLVTTGCYLLPLAIMGACDSIDPSDRGEYELADAVNLLIESGHRFEAVTFTGWRRNVNSPEDIDAVEERLRWNARG